MNTEAALDGKTASQLEGTRNGEQIPHHLAIKWMKCHWAFQM
jgi:hypothetical protein